MEIITNLLAALGNGTEKTATVIFITANIVPYNLTHYKTSKETLGM